METASKFPTPTRTLTGEYRKDGLFRILSLDGGGAKGFYTLGALKEIEGMLKCPLYQCFDLIFGTSTGSIIAALLALGFEIDEIHDLYRKHVPAVMRAWLPSAKSAALKTLAKEVFGEATFLDVKTGIGVVATKWAIERPMIFKGSVTQAHGRQGTFAPGFGATIGTAVQASCSAYPYFLRQTLKLTTGEHVELADGGFCANNPTLYAIADAVAALKKSHDELRVVSIGVGVYPEKNPKLLKRAWKKCSVTLRLLQKVLEVNTQSMEQLRAVLFKSIKTVRISDTFSQPEMATDFMEYDLMKLDLLWQRGRESFAEREPLLREYLCREA
ncbi:MAG TPA: patatin-like phospholipase family protein [Pirellulales bacterium]|nr:patatin-like phospholipase family protein [Pirellulales bacterium]